MTTEAVAEIEWHTLYARRRTLFYRGAAVGDYYLAADGVWRVRLWPPDRLQGGRERLVLSEALAQAALLELLERARREETEQ